jgi:hypothetical protein
LSDNEAVAPPNDPLAAVRALSEEGLIALSASPVAHGYHHIEQKTRG